MRMILAVAAVITMVITWSTGCSGKDDLVSKLAFRARTDGLALAENVGGRPTLQVVVFGKGYREEVPFAPELIYSRFSGDGRHVIGLSRGWETQISTADGRIVRTFKTPFRNPRELALSPDFRQIVYCATRLSSGVPIGYVSVVSVEAGEATNSLFTIDKASGGSQCSSLSWAPDSHAFVLERNGYVTTYDFRNGGLRELATGTLPAWSPDGLWIAFRTPDGSLARIPSAGPYTVEVLLGTTNVIGGIHWSPDSRYLAFGEMSRTLKLEALFVLRVSDRAHAQVVRPTLKMVSARHSGWLLLDPALMARLQERSSDSI
jgi:WD40 repeat protein